MDGSGGGVQAAQGHRGPKQQLRCDRGADFILIEPGDERAGCACKGMLQAL